MTPTGTNTTTAGRFQALCTLIGVHPRVALPRDVPGELADRLLDAVIADADRQTLRALCGDTTYTDGYAKAALADWDLADLKGLVREARIRVGRIDREIEQLQQQRDELTALLKGRQ